MANWQAPNQVYAPPKADEPPLHRAAREGDHDAIERLVAEGSNIDQVFDIALDPSGCPRLATPLMVAAGSGDGATVETIRLLLSLGAVPTFELDGETAATFACRGLGWNYRPGGDADRLKALLAAGSPLYLAGNFGARLVADVAQAGDANRLAILLNRGGPADAVWDVVQARRRSEEFVEEMLQRQRQLASDDIPEEFLASTEAMQREMIDRQASGPYSFEIPLFQAVESGSLECVRLLIEAGTKIDQRDNSGRTALWHAKNIDIARLLVEQGLSLEDRDQYDWTPLCANLSDPQLVKMLIQLGADVNATHDRGYSVFMSAVGQGNLEVLKLLVAAGANPYAVSDLGYNAFHAAIDVSNDDASLRAVFGYLRELGVDIEHRNHAGYTPLARALAEGTASETRALCQLGADVNTPVRHLVCEKGECVPVTIPPIFVAVAATDSAEKLKALLDAGAKLQVRDRHGRSPSEAAEAKAREVEDSKANKFKEYLVQNAARSVELLWHAIKESTHSSR